MLTEAIVTRNLAILGRLSVGPGTLEEIADGSRFRPRVIDHSLRVLGNQGLVIENDGVFALTDPSGAVRITLQLVDAWLAAQTESFYEIAKETAYMIHNLSWSETRVRGVLLFGSTLTTHNPRDIDMVILHAGGRLREFENLNPYAVDKREARYDIPASHPENRRLYASSLLRALGFADGVEGSDERHNVLRAVGERISSLGLGARVSSELTTFYTNRGYSEEDLASRFDMYGVDSLFDIHVLHTGLLGDPEAIRYDWDREQFATQRQEAIESGADPSFWHTVLSEGRLYDRMEMDFARTVNEVYPGAVDLFANY